MQPVGCGASRLLWFVVCDAKSCSVNEWRFDSLDCLLCLCGCVGDPDRAAGLCSVARGTGMISDLFVLATDICSTAHSAIANAHRGWLVHSSVAKLCDVWKGSGMDACRRDKDEELSMAVFAACGVGNDAVVPRRAIGRLGRAGRGARG